MTVRLVQRLITDACIALYSVEASRIGAHEIVFKRSISASRFTLRKFPGNAEVQYYGLNAMGNLSSNPEAERRFVESGGCDIVVTALINFPDHAGVQESGLHAMRSLSFNEKQSVDLLKEEDVKLLCPH